VRALVVGAGALGARAARQLLTLGDLDRLSVADADSARADAVVRSLGGPARACGVEALPFDDVDVVVLAHPSPEDRARQALQAGAHVVVAGGLLKTARDLVALDAEARERERSVVIGAAMSPGLSCLLVREAARRLSSVTSIEVAAAGAGGPACSSDRRRALASAGVRWDGAWHYERGGTGRRLSAFPDPVGSKDCFAAGTAEAFLVATAFPSARVTSAVAATALERVTSALPRIHRAGAADGGLGAVRVEVHGQLPNGSATALVLGAIDRPALAGGAVAAVAARWASGGRFCRSGAGGLAALVDDPQAFLRELSALGVRAAEFSGSY
jgi:hypothetical protein